MSECAYVLSPVQLFAIPWTVAHQAPLSKGVSRQEDWSGLPRPPPRDLPDTGIELVSLVSPALAGRFCTTSRGSVPSLSGCWPGEILVILLLGETNLTRKLKIYGPKINRSRKAVVGLASRP